MLIIILFIIIAGVVSFVIPRFRDAYRELRSKLFVVERTKRQLYTYKNIYEQVIGTSGEDAARKILDVSRDNGGQRKVITKHLKNHITILRDI
ncbi:MAG: hypothetical protein RR875_03795 [Clostridium sp.]